MCLKCNILETPYLSKFFCKCWEWNFLLHFKLYLVALNSFVVRLDLSLVAMSPSTSSSFINDSAPRWHSRRDLYDEMRGVAQDCYGDNYDDSVYRHHRGPSMMAPSMMPTMMPMHMMGGPYYPSQSPMPPPAPYFQHFHTPSHSLGQEHEMSSSESDYDSDSDNKGNLLQAADIGADEHKDKSQATGSDHPPGGALQSLLQNYNDDVPKDNDPTTDPIQDDLIPILQKWWFHHYTAQDAKKLIKKAERPPNATVLQPMRINIQRCLTASHIMVVKLMSSWNTCVTLMPRLPSPWLLSGTPSLPQRIKSEINPALLLVHMLLLEIMTAS